MYVYHSSQSQHIRFHRAGYLAFLRDLGVREVLDFLVLRLLSDLSMSEYQRLWKRLRKYHGNDYPCTPVHGMYEHHVNGVRRPRITVCSANAKNPNETLLHETGHFLEEYGPRDTSLEAQTRDQCLVEQYAAKRAQKPFNSYRYRPGEVRAREFARLHADRAFLWMMEPEKEPPPVGAPLLTPSPEPVPVNMPGLTIIGSLALKGARAGLGRQ